MKTLWIITMTTLALLLQPMIVAGNSMSPEFMVSNQDIDEYQPQAAYNQNHQEYFVVWHQSSGLQGRWVMGKRIDRWGHDIAEYTIAFEDSPPRDNAQPTVAYDPVNDRYLVAWIHDAWGDGSDWDVIGRLVPWDGPTPSLNGFEICIFTSKQWNPRAAYAGTQQEFLVTWWNEGTGGVASYVSAARIQASNGAVLNTYAVASGTEERVAPDVAYNQARNEYLITYQVMDAGGGNVGAVRMNAGGSILGGGEFTVAAWPDAETRPRVAASTTANQWMVVWQSLTGNPANYDVFARRVWVDGFGDIQQSAPVNIEHTDAGQKAPEVACYPGSEVFGISYEVEYSGSNWGISGRTLDVSDRQSEGQAIRTCYVGETVDSSNANMAAGPAGFLVVWEQERNGASYTDIPGRILWQEFADGFESGDLSRWSSVSP